MVNPGTFQGSRRVFLMSKKEEYKVAMQAGVAADVLATIQRQYFKRYPVDFPHDEEPAAEVLAAVDDDLPDQETQPPDSSIMSDEEYEAALEVLETRRKVLVFWKAVSSSLYCPVYS
jgi:hypothetical protein